MTVKELKEILNSFDDEKDVFTFSASHKQICEIESVADNNGHLQLNLDY